MKTFKKIKKILEFIWTNSYSTFYRDKYKKAGIDLVKDIGSIDDFKKLPYLTKDEIVNSDPFKRFFLPWEKFGSAAISSGTTKSLGSVSVVLVGLGLMEFYKKNTKKGREFKPWKIMRLLPPIQANRSIAESYYLMEKKKKRDINILGDINNLQLSAKLAAKLRIDFLVASPTILYFFLLYLKKEYDLKNIKKVTLLGEGCSKQKALIFRKAFKKAEFKYFYAMSEAQGGFIGQGCNYLDSLMTSRFHPSLNYYHEIVEGGLVVTDLNPSGFPLIRYKTGDAVEITDFECKCGQKRTMRVLGRINYDAVKIHGTSIYAHLVDKALLPFLKYLTSPDWQLHIFEETKEGKIMPKLKMQVVLKKGGTVEDLRVSMNQGISSGLQIGAKKTLGDLVKEGIFLPLEVEFIEGFPKVGKHRRIVVH